MRHRFLVPWLLLASLLLLQGCALQPQTAPHPQTHWHAEGKIAITTANGHTSATFNWQQFQEDYRLRLFGPFGVGTAWLIKEGKQVWFEDQEHGKQLANSAEQLMRKHLGWHLPVAELRYWLLGSPAPRSAITASERNPQGQLIRLQQLGWHMEFSQYQQQGTLWLPGKLVASQGPVKVIIVTKSWITPPSHLP